MPMALRSVSYGSPVAARIVSPGFTVANIAAVSAWVPLTKPRRTSALSVPKIWAYILSSVSRPRSS